MGRLRPSRDVAIRVVYSHMFQNNRLGLLRPLAAPISVAGTYFFMRRLRSRPS